MIKEQGLLKPFLGVNSMIMILTYGNTEFWPKTGLAPVQSNTENLDIFWNDFSIVSQMTKRRLIQETQIKAFKYLILSKNSIKQKITPLGI